MFARTLAALICAPALLALPLVLSPTTTGGGGHVAAPPQSAFGHVEASHIEIFFAVLEGLYRDGVSSAVVESVVAFDPESGYPSNFVKGCPICMPALDAFRVYFARPAFVSFKVQSDTFGEGLPAPETERLLGGNAPQRRDALQALVERWVGERMERLRLDETERTSWRRSMEEGRKRGMDMLAAHQRSGVALYEGFKECPLCEGAAAATQR
jgi:hypothetical protein